VRSDIYSLGATLYHLLTAQAPLEAKQRFLRPGSMPAIRDVNPQVSPHVEQAIAHGMAMHPDDRPSNTLEFRAELFGRQTAPRRNRLDVLNRMAGRASSAYPYATDNTPWRDALWQNRVLLLLLGFLVAIAVAVTALPAERPIVTSDAPGSTTTEVNHVP
jgi:serine/threonine-protein kinase